MRGIEYLYAATVQTQSVCEYQPSADCEPWERAIKLLAHSQSVHLAQVVDIHRFFRRWNAIVQGNIVECPIGRGRMFNNRQKYIA